MALYFHFSFTSIKTWALLVKRFTSDISALRQTPNSRDVETALNSLTTPNKSRTVDLESCHRRATPEESCHCKQSNRETLGEWNMWQIWDDLESFKKVHCIIFFVKDFGARNGINMQWLYWQSAGGSDTLASFGHFKHMFLKDTMR